MEIEFLVIILVGVLIAWRLGILFAKISTKVRDRKLLQEGQAFLEGRRKNIVKLDGEDINVNKFIFKDYDGELKQVQITPMPFISKQKTFFMSGVLVALSNLFKKPKLPSIQGSPMGKTTKEKKSRHKSS